MHRAFVTARHRPPVPLDVFGAPRRVRLIATEAHGSSATRAPETPPFRPPPRSPPTPSPRPAPAPAPSSPSRTERPLSASFGRNQLIPVSGDIERDSQRIVASFKAPIRYAFGYGSGVFPQKSYGLHDRPMLDFIFAVSHPSHWHSINLHQNPHHYAVPIRWLGSGPISWLQESGPGAGVWFNVGVNVDGRNIKYGVVSVDSLCRDLLDWETLYIGGRMQKPIHILRDDARVRLANQVNLASALRTALLMLPATFTERDLYIALAGLSYRGDFRMQLGENPRKVANIVDAQLDHFRTLYGPLVRALRMNVVYVGGGAPAAAGGSVRRLEQDLDPKARAGLARRLPTGLRDKLRTDYDRKWNLQRAQQEAPAERAGAAAAATGRAADEAGLWRQMVADPAFPSALDRGLAQIVRRPAFNQSAKGVLSAGFGKSLRYIGPKLQKWWRSAPAGASPPGKGTPPPST